MTLSILLMPFLRKRTLYLVSLVLIAISVTDILKKVFKVPRPAHACMKILGYSFPSGHALISSAFFFYFILSSKRSSRFLMVSFPLLISASRLYFGVHRIEDVVFGMLVGILLAFLMLRFEKKKLQVGAISLCIVSLLWLILSKILKSFP